MNGRRSYKSAAGIPVSLPSMPFSDCLKFRHVRGGAPHPVPVPGRGRVSLSPNARYTFFPKHCLRLYINTSFHHHASWPHAILHFGNTASEPIVECRNQTATLADQLTVHITKPSFLQSFTSGGRINPDFWLAIGRIRAPIAVLVILLCHHRASCTRMCNQRYPKSIPDLEQNTCLCCRSLILESSCTAG